MKSVISLQNISNLQELKLEHTASIQGETHPLIMSSQEGLCHTVKTPLEVNDEENTTDASSDNALIMASQKGHYDVVKLLMERKPTVDAADKDGRTALIWASENGHCDIVKLLLEKNATVHMADNDGMNALIVASGKGHSNVVKLLLEKKAAINTADQDGWTALTWACTNGHCVTVKLLLEKKPIVNTVDNDGMTALKRASENGHCDIVKLLLERKDTVNTADKTGWTALMWACFNGHCDAVQLLLDWEATVNTADEAGCTALILASKFGYCDVVKVLLGRQATVNTDESYGWTALIWASFNGHCDVVKLLLDWKATVNKATLNGWTALILACKKGHDDVVKLLVERKANVNITDEQGRTALIEASQKGHCDAVKLLLNGNALVNAADKDGRTALMQSSLNGRSGVVKLLLESKATVNTVDNSGWGALALASMSGHSNVVKLMLEREAAVNAATKHGFTSLIWASDNGHFEVVRLLLEKEASVNTVTWNGMTALILASEKGHCDVVKLLLEKKAAVNQVNKYGWTALLRASHNGHCDAVRLLLEVEVIVDAADKDGRTALILASWRGHCEVVKLLLEKKAAVDAADKNGRTALIRASENGHCDVVKLLLEKNASVNTADNDGWTALIRSSKNGHHDVVKLLEKAAAKQDIETALLTACENGQWDTVKNLIDDGADVSHISEDDEIVAMYIIFAVVAKKCEPSLGKLGKNIWSHAVSQKSQYAMSCASFALVGALLYNTTNECFDSHFAQTALHDDVMYAFLPNIILNSEGGGYLFAPYQGVEGKISLHTLATAVLCKVPHTALQWLTASHRDKLVNMLGQTPLHLLAMENHIIGDMEEKIHLLTETVGFSFSDRDNNGRVPYHIACLCHNAQFLCCSHKFDSDIRTNMLLKDHLGKKPLTYMAYLLCSTTESPVVPLPLKLLSARKSLSILSQSMDPGIEMNNQLHTFTNPMLINNMLDNFRKQFKTDMTVAELSNMTNNTKDICVGAGDIASLFKCSTRGIVNLRDKQHIVTGVIHLLQLVGHEMGKMNPLFECTSDLKGSVQEYTKCGELDEIDVSLKLVNFTDYFNIQIRNDGIKVSAEIEPTCNQYWISGRFASREFCADFWQILLKALDSEATRCYIKRNCFVIENLRRKNGFVGMLYISCELDDSYQLISVDVIPTIVSDKLNGYVATLRPRHHGNKEVGDEFYQGLELSTSQKDWDLLKMLQPEVMCAYALVKMLRSLAVAFQTEQDRVYTAEELLPSYMLKTALLWILDPQKKLYSTYPDVETHMDFHIEDNTSWGDVSGFCQELLQDAKVVSGLVDTDQRKMLKTCAAGYTYLTVTDSIQLYVLETKRSDRHQQNGINLQLMQDTLYPNVEDISHQGEMIYNRQFYTKPEAERAWNKHKNENKSDGRGSYHKISYPDINEETARKCRVWARRILKVLQYLLQHDGAVWSMSKFETKQKITGVRNYYLPDQEIYAKDKNLVVALCQVLETVLE